MLLNELQTMASSLGIAGTARMRKGDLIAAIEESQADSRVPRARGRVDAGRGDVAARGDAPRSGVRAEVRDGDSDAEAPAEPRSPRRATRAGGPPEPREDRAVRSRTTTIERTETEERGDSERGGGERAERNSRPDRGERGDRGDRHDRNGGDRGDRGDRSGGDRYGERAAVSERTDRAAQNGHADADEDGEGGRRSRRSRFRDRRRGRGERGGDNGAVEPQVSEDDVLVQVAGIVDVLDNYAFVRTSGYPRPDTRTVKRC